MAENVWALITFGAAVRAGWLGFAGSWEMGARATRADPIARYGASPLWWPSSSVAQSSRPPSVAPGAGHLKLAARGVAFVTSCQAMLAKLTSLSACKVASSAPGGVSTPKRERRKSTGGWPAPVTLTIDPNQRLRRASLRFVKDEALRASSKNLEARAQRGNCRQGRTEDEVQQWKPSPADARRHLVRERPRTTAYGVLANVNPNPIPSHPDPHRALVSRSHQRR
ncbi:unnamed protein product [Cutaneotrichosporon oleaginosum]